MSNRIYALEFFNEEQKNRFIENLSESSAKSYSRIFKVSAIIENQVNKDVYDFELEELIRLLHLFTPKSYSVSQSHISLISSYISWAIGEGLRADNLNPLHGIVSQEFIDSFVFKHKKDIFTMEEVNIILRTLSRQNAQDQAMLLLMFEKGFSKSYSNILDLRTHNLLEDNYIILKNRFEIEQKVKISERCYELLVSASLETHYDIYISSRSFQLINNKYVFRPIAKNKNHDKAYPDLVNRRFKSMATDLKQPALTPTNIKKSGMLYEAAKLFYSKDEDCRDLSKEDYNYILNLYDYDTKQDAISRLKKNFLNVDKIIELYPSPII